MKRLLLFSRIVLLILLFANITFSQNYWDYPVKPGTKEWKSLNTIQEIIAVQQIPENLLQKMTTEELFQAWMDLPGRLDVLAFNTMQRGFDVTIERYNVLPVLLARRDVGPVALERYFQINPSDMRNDWSSGKKGQFITDIGFIEFLISQPSVLNTLPKPEKKLIAKSILDNIVKKQTVIEEDRDLFWEESSVILLGRILQNEGYDKFILRIAQKPNLERSLERGEIILLGEDINIYEDVINIAEDYLSE